MECTRARNAWRVRIVWALGVITTLLVWLFLTTSFLLTPLLFISTSTVVILTFIFVVPVASSACIWQNRLRLDYLDGYLPKRWSRESLFWVLGRRTTVGQKIVVFQTAVIGYLLCTLFFFLNIAASSSLLLSYTFAGMIATLLGDAVAVYMLTEHRTSATSTPLAFLN